MLSISSVSRVALLACGVRKMRRCPEPRLRLLARQPAEGGTAGAEQRRLAPRPPAARLPPCPSPACCPSPPPPPVWQEPALPLVSALPPACPPHAYRSCLPLPPGLSRLLPRSAAAACSAPRPAPSSLHLTDRPAAPRPPACSHHNMTLKKPNGHYPGVPRVLVFAPCWPQRQGSSRWAEDYITGGFSSCDFVSHLQLKSMGQILRGLFTFFFLPLVNPASLGIGLWQTGLPSCLLGQQDLCALFLVNITFTFGSPIISLMTSDSLLLGFDYKSL